MNKNIVLVAFTLFPLFSELATADCGETSSPNEGPPGSYQQSCRNFVTHGSTIYAICDGCGDHLTSLKIDGNACQSIANDHGALVASCISQKTVNTSFTSSEECAWSLSPGFQGGDPNNDDATLFINCGRKRVMMSVESILNSCKEVRNDHGTILCIH